MNNIFIGTLFILMIASFLFAVVPWIFSFFYEMISMFLEQFDLSFSKKPKTRKVIK